MLSWGAKILTPYLSSVSRGFAHVWPIIGCLRWYIKLTERLTASSYLNAILQPRLWPDEAHCVFCFFLKFGCVFVLFWRCIVNMIWLLVLIRRNHIITTFNAEDDRVLAVISDSYDNQLIMYENAFYIIRNIYRKIMIAGTALVLVLHHHLSHDCYH